MGPARIRPGIAFVKITSIARNDEKHLIDFAITIPVIDGEIGCLCLTQLLNSFLLNTFTIISASMPASFKRIKFHWSIDIKLDIEAPSRLVANIVGRTT